METRHAYNQWANQYDTNENKTRDLEGIALREQLNDLPFAHCLEIGCGTGKNTQWLLTRATRLTGVDLSEEMLARARQKIDSVAADFIQADINQPWTFTTDLYDLVTFSLVLEHIEDLAHVFHQASPRLAPGGYLYLGELHPFKQYSGSKARFDTPEGQQVVSCFNHHASDFVQAARNNGLVPVNLQEYFDNDDRSTLPRILTLLFRKPRMVE